MGCANTKQILTYTAPEPGPTLVYASIASGEHLELHVDLHESIVMVKKRVQALLGEPVDNQHISARGAEIVSGTLAEHEVEAGAVLHLVFRDDTRPHLEAIFSSMGGDGWKKKKKWMTGAAVGQWQGVQTDENGRITGVTLKSNGLKGNVPASAFSWLCTLDRFDFRGNPQIERQTLVGHLVCTSTNLKDQIDICLGRQNHPHNWHI